MTRNGCRWIYDIRFNIKSKYWMHGITLYHNLFTLLYILTTVGENNQSLISLASRATSGQHLYAAWTFQQRNENRQSTKNQLFTTKLFVSERFQVCLCVCSVCVFCVFLLVVYVLVGILSVGSVPPIPCLTSH